MPLKFSHRIPPFKIVYGGDRAHVPFGLSELKELKKI
jgi:glutamate racemase